MRKVLCLSAFIMLMALCFGTVSASNWEIYVRGKLFNNMQVSGSHFYVPVQQFFDALKFCYGQSDDGTVFVTREPQTRRPLRIKGNSANFVFDGKPFTLPITQINGVAYMDLDSAAVRFDLEVTKTPQTEIIDVVDKVQRLKHQQEIEKRDAYEQRMSAKPADEPGQNGSADYDVEHPVKMVGDIEGFLDQNQWEARWKATVKNHADVPVNNVRIVLNILDGNGEKIDTQVKVVGSMNPGDTASADFYWQDSSRIIATPKVEIQHDPLPVNQKKFETKER